MYRDHFAEVVAAVRLVCELKERGISLELDDEALVVDDPRGRMTPTLDHRLQKRRMWVRHVLLHFDESERAVRLRYVERVYSETPVFDHARNS